MKNFILATLIILLTNFSFQSLANNKQSKVAVKPQTTSTQDSQTVVHTPRIFILMEIDNIVVDTIPPVKQLPNTQYIDVLKKLGYSVQTFETKTSSSTDPKLDAFLRKTQQAPLKLNDSNQKKIDETFVIRPWIKYLLEELTKSETATHILICSKSSNARIHSIIQNLDLDINKIPFKDVVEFVPREYFTTYISTIAPNYKITAKSALELRNRYSGKYGKILPTDYVILIDKIPDSQFILYERNHDLNIKISQFIIKYGNNYNPDFDQLEMKMTLDKIKKFTTKL